MREMKPTLLLHIGLKLCGLLDRRFYFQIRKRLTTELKIQILNRKVKPHMPIFSNVCLRCSPTNAHEVIPSRTHLWDLGYWIEGPKEYQIAVVLFIKWVDELDELGTHEVCGI